jgi:dTDP-4-amino-4,6-dideoxygalactose transaminase
MSIHKIGFALLDRQFLHEKAEILSSQEQCLSSGQYILGNRVDTLEQRISNYCNTEYCVTVNSGTDALVLALKVLGIGSGDEVITPANSFIASTSSIIHAGATPILADVGPDQNIDPDGIEQLITPRTKAIMPVHLTGRMADMKTINAIAERFNLLVIEDAAQSFGSSLYNQKSGSMSDIACFSAHPLKVFNACGDAGFLVTNNKDYAEKARSLRSHGMIDRNTVASFGYVSRLDALQAEILLIRLEKIDQYIQLRRKNAATYRKLIQRQEIFMPECKPHEYNSFQTFVIQCDNRDELQQHLRSAGIESNIHYPRPIHQQPAFEPYALLQQALPKTEEQAMRILSIPVSQFLEPDEVCYVAETINGFYDKI